MFELPLIQVGKVADWHGTMGIEFVATFGLLATIFGTLRWQEKAVPDGGLYITAGWFTASTSFANPAVTFARSFTNTFQHFSGTCARLHSCPACSCSDRCLCFAVVVLTDVKDCSILSCLLALFHVQRKSR